MKIQRAQKKKEGEGCFSCGREPEKSKKSQPSWFFLNFLLKIFFYFSGKKTNEDLNYNLFNRCFLFLFIFYNFFHFSYLNKNFKKGKLLYGSLVYFFIQFKIDLLLFIFEFSKKKMEKGKFATNRHNYETCSFAFVTNGK